jgi:hypothetical protein
VKCQCLASFTTSLLVFCNATETASRMRTQRWDVPTVIHPLALARPPRTLHCDTAVVHGRPTWTMIRDPDISSHGSNLGTLNDGRVYRNHDFGLSLVGRFTISICCFQLSTVRVRSLGEPETITHCCVYFSGFIRQVRARERWRKPKTWCSSCVPAVPRVWPKTVVRQVTLTKIRGALGRRY